MSHAKLEQAVARRALEQAHAARLAGELEATVDHLLEAWAAVRDLHLGDAIDMLTHEALELRPPVTDESQWLHRCHGADALEVGRLLRKLPRRPSLIVPGLEALMAGPPDPRLASAAMRQRHLEPWLMAHPLMARHLDPVYLSTLNQLQAPNPAREAEIRASVAELEALRSICSIELDAGGRAWLEAIVDKRPAPRCEDAREFVLLAEIATSPGALGPRSVYADLLSQRGEPHGEFIVLQMRAEQGDLGEAGQARIAALLSQFGQAWLGGLAQLIRPESLEWRAGFGLRGEIEVAGGRTQLTPREEAWLETHPGLRTFVALDGVGWL